MTVKILYLKIAHIVAYLYTYNNYILSQFSVILVLRLKVPAWINYGFLPPGPVVRNSGSHFSNMRCQEGWCQVGKGGSHPFSVHMAL